uniref:UDP-N-acetylglucosamine--peptide N-acetylglucosaminyltransferase-like protein n=1 Tax=Rhodopseudomonas palustris (strain DX-1) TaxID=652103 RepID=E6VQ08_RHOPX
MRRAHRFRRERRFAEAASAFLDAEGLAPGDRDALFFHAVALKEAGNDVASVDAYRALLTRHPTFAPGWSLFGLLLRDLMNYSESIVALRRSLELQEDIATRNALVISLCKAGLIEEARKDGLRNLHLKDAAALKNAAASSVQSLRLNATVRPFDVKNRQRNIIAFSLWGDDPTYIDGAIINARMAPHIYYGWTVRVYCDQSVPSAAVADLRHAGAQIAMVCDPALKAIKPMWRFLVSDDPNVDWFICRDADSRLNCQELLAVEEWLRSKKPFHVMRDHIYHMDLMLAGMWGGAAGLLPNLQSLLMSQPKYFNDRFADQAFLMYEVWPLIRDHVCTHDTYYQFHNGREFPSAYRLPRPVHVGGSVKMQRTRPVQPVVSFSSQIGTQHAPSTGTKA